MRANVTYENCRKLHQPFVFSPLFVLAVGQQVKTPTDWIGDIQKTSEYRVVPVTCRHYGLE